MSHFLSVLYFLQGKTDRLRKWQAILRSWTFFAKWDDYWNSTAIRFMHQSLRPGSTLGLTLASENMSIGVSFGYTLADRHFLTSFVPIFQPRDWFIKKLDQITQHEEKKKEEYGYLYKSIQYPLLYKAKRYSKGKRVSSHTHPLDLT